MKKVKVPREGVLFEHGNVQHAASGWKGNHGLKYVLYSTPEDVNLKSGVVFANGDSIQREVHKKAMFFWVMWNPCICLKRRRVLTVTCIGLRLLRG